MEKLNASPTVLRVLFAIAAVFYLIASLFMIVFLPPTLTVGYVMAWLMLLIGGGFLGVAWKLPEMVAGKSLIPYLLIAGTIVVRLVNGRENFSRGEGQQVTIVGLAIGLIVGTYLWLQVRRLQRAPVA